MRTTLLIGLILFIASCADPTRVVERWPNGKIKETRYYDNLLDTAQYFRTRYYQNGQKEEEGLIISEEQRLKIGEWKFWYSNGNLKMEMEYREGRPFNRYTLYHENGKVKETGTYNLESKLDGEWVQYDTSGRVKSSGNYYRGTQAFAWLYHDSNPPGESVFNYNGSLKTVYDSAGITEFEYGRKIVQKQGDMWTYFYPTGTNHMKFCSCLERIKYSTIGIPPENNW